jgi:hypothetical protein
MKTVLDFSKTLFFLLLISEQSMAQNTVSNALSQPGIIGTIVLLIMIVGAIIVLITLKLSSFLRVLTNQQAVESNHQLEEGIINLSAEQLEEILYRKQAIEYTLSGNELAGLSIAKDERGLVNHISLDIHAPLVSEKKKSYPIAELDPKLNRCLFDVGNVLVGFRDGGGLVRRHQIRPSRHRPYFLAIIRTITTYSYQYSFLGMGILSDVGFRAFCSTKNL